MKIYKEIRDSLLSDHHHPFLDSYLVALNKLDHVNTGGDMTAMPFKGSICGLPHYFPAPGIDNPDLTACGDAGKADIKGTAVIGIRPGEIPANY